MLPRLFSVNNDLEPHTNSHRQEQMPVPHLKFLTASTSPSIWSYYLACCSMEGHNHLLTLQAIPHKVRCGRSTESQGHWHAAASYLKPILQILWLKFEDDFEVPKHYEISVNSNW